MARVNYGHDWVFVQTLKLKQMKKFTLIFGCFVFLLCVSELYAQDKIEKSYTVDNFSSIFLKGPYRVTLRQSDNYSLTIKASEKYIELLEVSSDGGELRIEMDEKRFKKPWNIEVYINFRELSKLRIEGAVDLECDNAINTDNLKLEFEGAGNVELNIEASKVIADISGVGNFEIRGNTEYHKVSFDGIGNYDAQNLYSKFTLVESNGIGSVSVYACDKLKGEASGIGSIDYFGDPDDVDLEASGLGSVNGH